MKFEDIKPEDFDDIYKADAPLVPQSTMTIDEFVSMASHIMKHSAGPLDPKKQTSMSNSEFDDKSFTSKRLVQAALSKGDSELQQLMSKGKQQIQRKVTMLSNKSQEVSQRKGTRPILQHMFTQKWDQRPNRHELLKLPSNILTIDIQEQNEEMSEGKRVRIERIVKEGVDLNTLDASKPFCDLESSFELILASLSRAFNMSVRQAAALLTNNNQYLITACIKGVKGNNYEPVLQWYSLLIENVQPLVDLLFFESQQQPSTSTKTFNKVMTLIGSGFYSYNQSVVQQTFELMHAMFEELMQETELQAVAMKWFLMCQSGDEHSAGGFKLIVYATQQHGDFYEHAVKQLRKLCQTDDQLLVVLRDEMKNHTKSVGEYIKLVQDLLPSLVASCGEKIKVVGLIDHWVDVCAREAEQDGRRLDEDRVAALSTLCEIWLTFRDYVERREEMCSSILFVFKRAVRERTKSVRIAASGLLFKLLDCLGEVKNPNAPVIYKTLIFAIVENPEDVDVRSFYLANFRNLFTANKTIPIQLLLDPLLKQIGLQIDFNLSLKAFDFDFFLYISGHAKFTLNDSISLLEILGRIMLNQNKQSVRLQPNFTHLGLHAMAQVPFFAICETHLKHEPDGKIDEFIQSFMGACLEKLFELEPTSKQEALQQQTRIKKPNRASTINPHWSNQSKPPLKSRDLKSSQRLAHEVDRRLLKSLTVSVLIKLQSMMPQDATLNAEFKQKAIQAQVQFKALFDYENRGITALLSYYGDPASIMQMHLKSSREDSRRKSSMAEETRLVTGSEYTDEISRLSNSIDRHSNERKSERVKESREQEIAIYSDMQESRAVVPYNKPASIKDARSLTRNRAIIEIEKIQKLKAEKERKAAEIEQKQREASAKRKKIARDEVQKRKIALGVADKVVMHALTWTEEPHEKRIKKPVCLLELDETEEDRDIKPLNLLMQRHTKLWKHLFAKYQNAGFISRKPTAIEALQNTTPCLSLSETTKLLRDHDMVPQLMSKDELAQLVRMIVMKHQCGPDLQSITYKGFTQLIVQLAYNCFTRPPRDLSNSPTYEHLQALIDTFISAAKRREINTFLYEQTDCTAKDRELVAMLTEKINQDPTYPLPEGFTKSKETKPVMSYEIPASTIKVLGEAKAISILVIDDLCNKLFGVHVVTPKIRLEEKFKIKRTIAQISAPPAQVQENQALEVIKRLEENTDKISQSSNRVRLTKVKSAADDLSLHKDESSQERNLFTRSRAEQARLKESEDKAREQKRNERHRKVKTELERIKEEKKVNEEAERAQKQADEAKMKMRETKKEALKIARAKEEKERLIKFKEDQAAKLKQEQELKEKQDLQQAEARKQEREQFFANQQLEIDRHFKEVSKQRQLQKQQLSRKEERDREKEQRLKETVASQAQIVKLSKQKELELAVAMDEYLARPDIAEVMSRNEPGLAKVFKFFCKKQKQELDDRIPFMLEHMHFKQFTKFCLQTKIIPTVCSLEDVNSNFKNIVMYYRPGSDGAFSPFIDFETFKRALIRLGLAGKDTEAVSNDALSPTEIESRMREEYLSETGPHLVEEDFQAWLKVQESKGLGLTYQLHQQKRQAEKRRLRGSSISKDQFINVDLNKLTAKNLQELLQLIGIQLNGDINEKALEERRTQPEMVRKNTISRLSLRQRQTESKQSLEPLKTAAVVRDDSLEHIKTAIVHESADDKTETPGHLSVTETTKEVNQLSVEQRISEQV